MSMTLDKMVRLFFIGLITVAVLFITLPHVFAGGNCNGPGDDTCYNEIVDVSLTGGDVTTGPTDVNTGDNKSLAVIAPGLGDVDIAQCLGSTQWSLLVGAKQKLVLNQVCMAEFYLKQGRYDLAAQALCNQPEILEEYTTESECQLDHNFTPAKSTKPNRPAGEGSSGVLTGLVESEEQHTEDIHSVQVQLAQVVDQLEQYQSRPTQAPVIVQQQAPTYSDDQFYSVMSVLKGSDEVTSTEEDQ